MENKEFFINKDGFKLHAKLALPDHSGKLPLLIIVHGLTGHMEEDHIIAAEECTVRAGYAALRVEMYGHGMSDGLFCNHNIAEWVTELMYIIDEARTWDFVSDIYLTGHSQGGLTVILTAPLKADQIKGILPLSPALLIPDICRSGRFFDTNYDAGHLPDKLYLWDDDKYVTSNYLRIGRTIHCEEAIKAYTGPVFIIHGTADESVPVSYATWAHELYENSELALIEGDTHCFDYHLDQYKEALYQKLMEWR